MNIKVHIKRFAVGAYILAAMMALIYVLDTYDKVLAVFVSALALATMYILGIIAEEGRSQT